MRCMVFSLGCASGFVIGAFASSLFTSETSGARIINDEFSSAYLSESERLAAIRRAAPDIADRMPLSFDNGFDNPCFYFDGALRCLPAFFIAGAMQCGTGVLWRRLKNHGLVPSEHDGASHWWTLHPRSRAGLFDRYLGLFSTDATLAKLRAKPKSLLGEYSQASFTFMFAEQLRLHYLYLDAFAACHAKCRSRDPPPQFALQCARKKYDFAHCYDHANNATVPDTFNIPSLIATVLAAKPPKLIALLREPSERLWVAFWEYGQYPARYGKSHDGFRYYFGNQSAAFDTCVNTNGRGRRKCALRFEGYGAAEADVYYHADQLVKGMYAVYLAEWQAALGRENLLILRTEDQIAHPMRTLKRVVSHLRLRPMRDEELRKARAVEVADEAEKVREAHGTMEPGVRAAVRAFYEPFNKALARQLGDPGFLWPERQRLQLERCPPNCY